MLLSATLAVTALPAGTAAAAGTAGAGTVRAAAPPRVPAGTTAGYMVVDRVTGRTALAHNARGRFRSASLVKILIALDYLESRTPGKAVPAADGESLKRMLRSSDDAAASAFWRRGGQRAIIDRMVRRVGLRDTDPPPPSRPGFWGYTALSAADMVRTYRYLLDRADPKIRDLILGHLRRSTRCASDDFDQSFGIPSAVPKPWAVKQGWSGYGTVPAVPCSGGRSAGSAAAQAATPSPATAPQVTAPAHAPVQGATPAQAAATQAAAPGQANAGPATGPVSTRPPVNLARPVLHTTGLVGKGDRLIVVVLTLQPAGASYAASAARLTALTKQVYRAGLARTHSS
ncbi:lipoprotein [Sphaerisporangium melleum]|uniref:Lipoprotein n=1 Tax=Sphaerisporangium melleum TaxID=321316 RepID=A0A917R602_9ACTN|nr:lipoprotein [Sphaerisporangium melleum]GII72858.1 lipoprotein [Sphaerisporangium melleum]